MGEGGIFKQLTKALIERCLTAELDTHLEEEKVEPNPERPKNRRNGHKKDRERGIWSVGDSDSTGPQWRLYTEADWQR